MWYTAVQADEDAEEGWAVGFQRTKFVLGLPHGSRMPTAGLARY